jgi:hypothetical protein
VVVSRQRLMGNVLGKNLIGVFFLIETLLKASSLRVIGLIRYPWGAMEQWMQLRFIVRCAANRPQCERGKKGPPTPSPPVPIVAKAVMIHPVCLCFDFSWSLTITT